MLNQNEFENLLKIKKKFKDDADLLLGPHPIRWSRDIISLESSDNFILDYTRNNFEIKKYSINKRYRTTIVLLRYCSSGKHTNPGGVVIDGPHFHYYKEGFEDKYAFDPQIYGIDPTLAIDGILRKLLVFFNVQNLPTIMLDMF